MFHGSMVALVTPMLENGVVDVDALRQLVEWHIAQGTTAIVVLGSTGEAPTLNELERKLVIEQALAQSADRVPIIAGTGTNCTESTVHFTRQAMELGADACLIVTPYYNKPTQEGLYQHYKTVAEAVPLPIILYNVPSRTACDLKAPTVERLSAIPNIIGIKEATGDLARLREIIALTDHAIDLYSGDDASCVEFMLAGGKGVISVTANIAPKAMQEICLAALAGDREKANHLNHKLAEFHKHQGIETNPIPVKWALNVMGKVAPGIRLPLTPLSDASKGVVRAALDLAELM